MFDYRLHNFSVCVVECQCFFVVDPACVSDLVFNVRLQCRMFCCTKSLFVGCFVAPNHFFGLKSKVSLTSVSFSISVFQEMLCEMCVNVKCELTSFICVQP